MPIEKIEMQPIHALDVSHDGKVTQAPNNHPAPPEDCAYRWLHIDLSDPLLDRWCAKNLHPQSARTLLAAKTRPRVDIVNDGIVLTLRGVNMNAGFEQADMVSLRLWIAPKLVVSVRRQRVFAMERLHTEMTTGKAPSSPMHLVARVAGDLVERVETVSLSLEDLADDLETLVYERDEPAPKDLAPLRRQTIKMRRHIGPMAEALRELSYVNHDLIPADLRLSLRDTASSARRSLEELSEVQERLTALTDHLDIQQTARLERNGYRLSVAAGVLLPMSIMTGLFGVNLGGIPGINDPNAFWWFTGAMVVVAALLALFLRWARWF